VYFYIINLSKGERFNLKQISKQEMQWLIANKYLKMEGGRYLNLTITGRKSKRKKRYVPENIYNKLKFMK
jgi:hypothetical protein